MQRKGRKKFTCKREKNNLMTSLPKDLLHFMKKIMKCTKLSIIFEGFFNFEGHDQSRQRRIFHLFRNGMAYTTYYDKSSKEKQKAEAGQAEKQARNGGTTEKSTQLTYIFMMCCLLLFSLSPCSIP